MMLFPQQSISPCTQGVTVGQIFTASYPFIRDVYSVMDADGVSEAPTWRPGTRFENTPTGDTDTIADGIGQQELTVVSLHKPGKFPTRVFFTRKWRDPSGRMFGKGKLHILSMAPFLRLTRGYRYEFEMSDPVCHPAKIIGGAA